MQSTPSEQEQRQRAALVRQRRIASVMLLVMAALFVLAKLMPEPGFWTGLLQAGAEAALVGGLADWFAVTALFRQPFGLPIPHTAIIPRNKARIGEGLGTFVERHFLAPELLQARLRRIDFAARFGHWLAQPANADRVAKRASAALPYVMELVQDREVRDFFRRTLNRQIEQINLAPLAGKFLQVLTESDQHQALFDGALVVARRLVEEHQERVCELVAQRTSWWVPSTVDRAIAERIIAGVLELLDELAQHDHPARRGFDAAVGDLVQRLQHSPEYHAKVEAAKRELLRNPTLQAYLGSAWDELKQLVMRDLNAPSSRLRRGLAAALRSVATHLPRDERLRQRVNRRVERMLLEVVVPWRGEIGRFITDVVKGWDTRTVVQRVELAVGRDLQFIRINGTVVGALAGCGLFLLSAVLF